MTSEEEKKLFTLKDKYNQFGLHIFKSITQPGKNAFISPVGLALSAALLSNGASGETKESILTTLQIDEFSLEELNTLNKELIELISLPRTAVQVEIATSSWFNNEIKIFDTFKQKVQEHYFSEVHSCNFSDTSYINLMNHWVREKTHGLISKIAGSEEHQINSLAFIILNVIYFKGFWLKQFDEKNTQDEMFFLDDGNQKLVPMMQQNNEFLYTKTDTVEVIQLSYGSGFFGGSHAYIFLPAESSSLNHFLQAIDYQTVLKLTNSLEIHSGSLKLPRFSFEYKINLTEALKNHGMEKVFDSKADFSQMSNQSLFIKDIIQKTSIIFNEKGTEIATLTQTRGIMGMPPPFSMTVNRPFFVAITHHNTLQQILFIGCIYDP